MCLLGLVVVGLAGCGYTSRSLVTQNYKSIYVEPFVNKIDIANDSYAANKYRIYRPTLESDISKAVSEKFLFDGTLKSKRESVADLVLKGELVEFRKDPLRYDDNNEVLEYRVNLVVNIGLWDNKDNRLLFTENRFTGDTSYFVSGTQALTEDTAIREAISDLARRIVERVVEQW
jgi:outer membrane lipopolysaccharide assembly protein LptE/RlpB